MALFDRSWHCSITAAIGVKPDIANIVVRRDWPKADMGFPELLLCKITAEPYFADRRFLFESRLI